MAPVRVALIWAMSDNRVIGKDNQLPWHLPDDLRHFKRTTLGAPVIMGRLTYESTGGALPGRTNIIVTTGDLGGAELPANVLLAASVDQALELGRAQARADSSERCFVCGGSAVYVAALPLADELFVTQVHAEVEGDTFFPPVDLAAWECLHDELHPADERHAHAFSLRHYRRPETHEGVAAQDPS